MATPEAETQPLPQSPPQSQPSETCADSSSKQPISLQQRTSRKHKSKSKKIFGRFRAVLRSFPMLTPQCRIPISIQEGLIQGGARMTGTVFGRKKARASLAIQENPKSLPILVLELAVTTGKLLQDLGQGLVRIALECERHSAEKTKILEEPIWTMFYNGKKSGYGVKRQATEDDLMVMQLLHAVSMGAAVIPIQSLDQGDEEITYMRTSFERVVGSKDSETYHMVNPDTNSDSELSIFFVRL